MLLVAIPLYLLLDAPYLLLLAAWHEAHLRRMTAGSPLRRVFWPAAALFYVLAPLGAIYLVLGDGRRDLGIRKAMLRGAVLGALMYGTWDLTCLAVLGPELFSPTYAALDVAWGTCVMAALMGILVSLRIA